MKSLKMAIDDWDYEEITAECPSCWSDNVVIDVNEGYFFVVRCKECGFQAY